MTFTISLWRFSWLFVGSTNKFNQ